MHMVQMTPGQALARVRAGGFVVCVGVPPGTSVGIDLSSFTTGERFLGFKMVPANEAAPGAPAAPGAGAPTPHLLHWAAREGGVRTSLCVSVRAGGVAALWSCGPQDNFAAGKGENKSGWEVRQGSFVSRGLVRGFCAHGCVRWTCLLPPMSVFCHGSPCSGTASRSSAR